MKHKILLIGFVLLMSTSMFAANTVVYTQNFENVTINGNFIGDTEAANFGGGALWSFDLDSNTPISGTKSAHFNITNTGSDWWTLQYKIDSKFSVIKGARYKITFKIKSSGPTTIMYKVQATADFTQNINLTGGTVQSVTVITTPMDRNGSDPNFMLGLGNPSVPCEIWVDDIVIEQIEETYLPDGVVYSQDFESATVSGNFIGDTECANYGGGAAWTFGLDATNPISGTKSAYMNITNTGSDWWTLQYKVDSKFSVIQGIRYKVSFKIKSSVPTTIMYKVQATANFSQNLVLTGSEVQSFSIITDPMDVSAANPNFQFSMGNPAVPAQIWIDDLVIEKLSIVTAEQKIKKTHTIENVEVWKNNDNLIINVPEPCDLNVFNSVGQKIIDKKISEGQSILNLPIKNVVLIVKLKTEDNRIKIVKL